MSVGWVTVEWTDLADAVAVNKHELQPMLYFPAAATFMLMYAMSL